jgi:hypothetical protein
MHRFACREHLPQLVDHARRLEITGLRRIEFTQGIGWRNGLARVHLGVGDDWAGLGTFVDRRNSRRIENIWRVRLRSARTALNAAPLVIRSMLILARRNERQKQFARIRFSKIVRTQLRFKL